MLGSQARPALHPNTDVEAENAPAPEGSGFDWRDGLGALGLLLVVAGVWQVYAPAAWIVLGASLLLVAWRI